MWEFTMYGNDVFGSFMQQQFHECAFESNSIACYNRVTVHGMTFCIIAPFKSIFRIGIE